MKYKELAITVSIKKIYAKPYIQKIRSIIWNRFEATCEIEDNSFDMEDYCDTTIYFIATEEQGEMLKEIIDKSFREGLGIHYNF